MRLSGSMRPIIFGFVPVIIITLALPYLAFGAARSLGGSGGRSSAPRMHRQRSFSQPFHRFGFVDVGGVDEQQVIIIQQFQPAAVAKPTETATNRIYVPPRWVDGGYGVEVLQPGYWADPKQAAER